MLLQSVAWGLVSALVLSIGVAWFLAHRNELRIERLSRVLSDASGGNLDQRYTELGRTNDDITRVAAQVNQMLARLSQNMENLRQISTDVAHDLRAPLTRLRARIEPHYLRSDLPEETRQDLQKAMEDMETLVSTFDAILRLAQIESGSVKIGNRPVDLSLLCLTMSEMLEPVAGEVGHVLVSKCGTDPLIIKGDKDLLSQAIVNLIENAFRHCPAPATVCVTTGEKDSGIFIKICDNGPGIEPGQHKAVLRRFYRLEKSRSKAGNGLGLNLVNAITKAHGGSLELRDNAPGLCVILTFPKD